jgi:hypothetical protein
MQTRTIVFRPFSYCLHRSAAEALTSISDALLGLYVPLGYF